MFFGIFVLLGGASALSQQVRYFEKELAHVYFEKFIIDYNREYASQEEKMMRFDIFKENLEIINKVNKRHGFEVYGINKFTDISSKEKFTGCFIKSNLTQGECTMKETSGSPAPAQLDWRQKGAVTPVKNQGKCEGCYTFSTIGAIESQVAIQKGQQLDLAEQQIIDCDKTNGGCHGGLMTKAFRYIINNGGIESESDYPYEEKDDQCKFDKSKAQIQLSDCYEISTQGTPEKWKQALNEFGPLSIGLVGSEIQPYNGGVLECSGSGTPDHALLLVGYGDDNGKPFWIIKNSWGPSWGEQGFLRMKMTDNPCGMYDTEPSVPVLA